VGIWKVIKVRKERKRGSREIESNDIIKTIIKERSDE
jgi:hypothetical protein